MAPGVWSVSCGREICRSSVELNALPPETEHEADAAQTASGFYDPPCAPGITLVFELDLQDAPRLLRLPALHARRMGAIRSATVNFIWHDTGDARLTSQGLALCQDTDRPGIWRLERLTPADALDWPPAACPPVLAEACSREALPDIPATGLVPAAAFTGKRRSMGLRLNSGAGRIDVLDGAIRGVADGRPACLVLLTGTQSDAAGLALELAAAVKLRVPRQSLAASAIAFARGRILAPRRLGAPSLPPGLTASDAFACIAAHLADVILHWSDLVPQATAPEPVHQMRVAVRRLRSALSVFRRAAIHGEAGADWLFELSAGLRDLAARLGIARDWDVFIGETGAEIQAVFPADRRIGLLLAAASRKRMTAYADLGTYLASQEWATLSLKLALLATVRPWDQTGDRDTLAATARLYAAQALDRRLKHLLAPGADLSGLPAAELHETRKQAKRLRYATEFFAPLFAGKAARKYIARLAELQEVLGAVNDTATAADLMDQLAGGADRAFAAGVVQGFGAARGRRAAAKVQAAWERFTRASPFWD